MTMNAAPAEIFPHIDNFHKWEAWSPWAKIDPNAKPSFEGPESGEGATFRWDGNDEVGKGSMKIIESKPNEKIKIELHFDRPMEATNFSEFTFVPKGDGTVVTWAMYGQHKGFVSKAVCLVMNLDKMVGSKYEEGLANLKAIVEKKDAPTEAKADTAK
jgi:hypothetical protein